MSQDESLQNSNQNLNPEDLNVQLPEGRPINQPEGRPTNQPEGESSLREEKTTNLEAVENETAEASDQISDADTTKETDKKNRQTTTARIFSELLAKIESGEWSIGSAIPSERTLIEQLGVSRIALREALSMLRVLGVLDISHGRSTTVSRMNTQTIAKLFPLMLTLDGIQSLEHIFEVRVALESQTAFFAAQKRSEDQLLRIQELASRFAEDFDHDTTESIEVDQEFHTEIAKATGNPLFEALLDALGKIVQFAQRESGRLSTGNRARAVKSHADIVQAIRDKEAVKARDAMIKHLKDATLSDAILSSTAHDASLANDDTV